MAETSFKRHETSTLRTLLRFQIMFATFTDGHSSLYFINGSIVGFRVYEIKRRRLPTSLLFSILLFPFLPRRHIDSIAVLWVMIKFKPKQKGNLWD
jgi:hypothetical protein